MEVFTPNTGQTNNLLTGERRAADIELRYNHNHDEKGRFAPSRGGGAKKGLTKKSSGAKMSKKECKRVSHEIATNFPNLKADGMVRTIYNRNHAYTFTVNGFGDYNFKEKKSIK